MMEYAFRLFYALPNTFFFTHFRNFFVPLLLSFLLPSFLFFCNLFLLPFHPPSPILNFSSNFVLLPFTFFLSLLLFFPPFLLFFTSSRYFFFTPSPLFLTYISQIRTFADPVFFVLISNSSQTSFIYFLSSHSNVKLIFSWYCV